jgi:AcrR family transcriptional regulator
MASPSYDREMTDLPGPTSRRDRQRQTREALVFAARAVFTEVGYHAASLDQIARYAGFSKGAVYSNFENKAALFLAVMDLNFDLAYADSWDPFQRVEAVDPGDGQVNAEELSAAMTGFALATLEFVAAAARDESLAPELAKRMNRLLEAYTGTARASRAADETVPAEDVGALLAALDQGAGLLQLGGADVVDQRLLRVGMRRLLDPARANEPVADAAGRPGLHDQVVQQRIAASLREDGGRA